MKHFYSAVATMIGYIIGAGILGMPYAVQRAGFLTGLVSIIILGIAVMFLNLVVGEIVLRTREKHQLTGYADKYLGRKGKIMMAIVMVLGAYGALTAYTVKEGQFLNSILSPIFGGSVMIYALLFFAVAAYIIFRGIDAIEKSELYLVGSILLIVLIMVISSYDHVSVSNLSHYNPAGFLIPFGVILFAFHGTGSIPEISLELKKNKKIMKKAIIIGSLIPIFIYAIFTALIIGITGAETSDGAILGIADMVGGYVLLLGTVFGILVLATSFLAVGLALREIYVYDLKFRPVQAFLLTCFIPLCIAMTILFLKVEHAFYKVLDITGSFDVPLGTLILMLIAFRAREKGDRKPEYSVKYLGAIAFIVSFLFLLAMVNQIKNLFF